VPHKEACGPIEMQKAYKVKVVIDKKAFVPLAVKKLLYHIHFNHFVPHEIY